MQKNSSSICSELADAEKEAGSPDPGGETFVYGAAAQQLAARAAGAAREVEKKVPGAATGHREIRWPPPRSHPDGS